MLFRIFTCLDGGYAIHLLEFIGEVVTVVEAAFVGDLADRLVRLGLNHLLC